jgi:WD40-like Beta Propeller Repeat.
MRIHYTILLLLFLLSPVVINAQYYDTGQDPWNLKWMQIKTGKYTVIYPEKYGSEGIEFAKSLNMANSALGSLFPEKKFRLPVVIHNFTVESNGYVAWAPKRMEIFPTPEQNTIPLDPRSQLTLHELAHVMQMEALNSGTIKVLSYFFGQQITGAAASLLPLWFMEGDAVFSETVLSGSGRGRSPDFQKKLKAIAIEKNHFYKYDKMVCGSFRDYTPDHYQFGYQMVAWSLASSDLNLWNRIMKFTATEPFSVIPVNISLRSNINLTKKLLYDQTFDVLKNMWQKDIDASGAKPYEPLNPDKNNRYINYYSPVSAGKDSIIAIKTSLADPPVFVLIDPSKKTEKNIHTPGNIYPWFITYGNGRIVWVETTVDPRWANREYSVIKMKDLRTGIIKQLTHRSRFLAASVSPDGKRIAAVENTYDNKNSLVFLGTSDGEVQKSIPVPDNASIQEPRWSDDGKKITVIFLTDAGEGIMLYSQAENTWKTLVEAGRNDLQSAQVRNDSLFFTSSVSGVENGFLLTPSGKLLEITNSRFGANDMIVNGSEVLFSDYTSAGSNICSAMLPGKEKESWTSEKKGSFLADRFDIKPASPEETGKEYTPQPYRKWQHLFGVHSWMPFYTDINAIETTPQTLRPGVVFLSQNLLSSLTATAGYEYSAEKRHMVHTNITWSGWYPVFQSQLDYGNESHFYHLSSSDPSPADTMSGYHFVNTISLPLAFSTGKFDQFLFLSASSDYQNNYIFISNSAGYDVGQLQLSGRILFYNYYKSAYRDIYPRWAQLIDFSYISSPYDQLFFGTDIYLKTAFYFPGFFHNNSIKLRFEGEQNNFSRYLTINRINFPRSYTNIVSGKLGVMSVDYEAPLFYPDFNISSVFYLTRIRGGLFYDRAIGYDNYSIETQNGNRVAVKQSSPEIFSSFGGELLADFHLFRIPYRISGGVQAAWKDIRKAPVFEMVFNMNINGTIIGKRPRL